MPTVILLSHTPEPERIVAAAAKLCYSESGPSELLDGLDREKSAGFIDILSQYGHESPLEHISFTFGIEGVSRAFLAQITRHRIASYSVQSQRYVNMDSFDYITPPEVEADPNSKAIFLQAMEAAGRAYNALADNLTEAHAARMIAEGVPEKRARGQARKLANEDARFVLPNACETRLVVTMNARSLINFFAHRCCSRAQWEIRAVADEMLHLVKDIAPSVFKLSGPPCLKEKCPEGGKSCGKSAEMRCKYLAPEVEP